MKIFDNLFRPKQTQAVDNLLTVRLKKWNWGAFLLNWVWGLGNNVYIALLMFVPGINLVMPFVLGFKGNDWAWQKGDWQNIHDFQRTQRLWTKVGIVATIGIPIIIFIIVTSIMISIVHSQPFITSFELTRQNSDVIVAIGEPIELDSWIISGSINYDHNGGHADLEYKVSGPMGSGIIRFVTRQVKERWQIRTHTLTLIPEGSILDLAIERRIK